MTLLKSSSTGDTVAPRYRESLKSRTVGRHYQSLAILVAIAAIMIGGIGSRLVKLQLFEGKYNLQQADRNRIRIIPKPPERGKILDRQGRLLAGSSLFHSVYVWPLASRQADWPHKLKLLSQILDIPESEIQQRIERAGDTSPYLLRIARGLSDRQVTVLNEYSSELEGIEVDVELGRQYPHAHRAAHVLGYTGEIDREELERGKSLGYRLGDTIGQMGIEAAFERDLRGEWGGRKIQVDSLGNAQNVLEIIAPKAGKDVYLTLDLDLQKAAEAALGKTKGAIVAMNPNNGEVLAMASYPSFDPNIFSTQISEKTWKELQGQDHPFVNRTIQGFPPASTFKIVTTTAAIESGKFSPYAVLPTYPYITVGGIQFWDWNRAGFGWLGFPGAMALSSDTFFYQVALEIGGPTLIEWTRQYGFGQKTGIELAAEEASGLVADERWKQLELAEDWYRGDTVNMSIGQGFLQASPLQVAVMFAVPANGGYRVTPHLRKDNREIKNRRVSLGMSPQTLQSLQKGLRWVVTQGTGTVMNAETLPPNAGKSGTAEDPPRLSHAWFGAYAPLERPEIVVVAFAENSGGGGSKVAAPKVRQVLEVYFKLKSPQK